MKNPSKNTKVVNIDIKIHSNYKLIAAYRSMSLSDLVEDALDWYLNSVASPGFNYRTKYLNNKD